MAFASVKLDGWRFRYCVDYSLSTRNSHLIGSGLSSLLITSNRRVGILKTLLVTPLTLTSRQGLR